MYIVTILTIYFVDHCKHILINMRNLHVRTTNFCDGGHLYEPETEIMSPGNPIYIVKT
jgi:hypothetical protein